MAVRALVVDDSAFFRKRIIEILKSDGEIEVVGGASNGREAVELVGRLKPPDAGVTGDHGRAH